MYTVVCVYKNLLENIIKCVHLVLIVIPLLILNAKWYKQQQHGALSVLNQIFDNLFVIIKYLERLLCCAKMSEATVMWIHNH